jgi:hypothetical protein
MVKNVGTVDKAVRIILGLVLVILPFVGVPSPWGWVAAAAGVIFIATGLINFCPIWLALGVNTGKQTSQS